MLNRNTITLERISPEVIYLRPPEKLVIEMKVTGRYGRIEWRKNNGESLSTQPQHFSNYDEIFARGETTNDDIGLYEVELVPSDPITQLFVPQGDLEFFVISPGI